METREVPDLKMFRVVEKEIHLKLPDTKPPEEADPLLPTHRPALCLSSSRLSSVELILKEQTFLAGS